MKDIIKLNTRNPKEIINYIDSNYKKLKGMCVYENKKLMSKSDKYSFDFDPYHCVLEINFLK